MVTKTEYRTVYLAKGEGRIDCATLKDQVAAYRFYSSSGPDTHWKRGCATVHNLTDEAAIKAWPAFISTVRVQSKYQDLYTFQSRDLMQKKIIEAAGCGEPGIIRVRRKTKGEPPVAPAAPPAAPTPVVKLDPNSVAIRTAELILADTRIPLEKRIEAAKQALAAAHIDMTTPEMIVAFAQRQALDEATRN